MSTPAIDPTRLGASQVDLRPSIRDWDRRRRDQTQVHARQILEHALQHLVLDQMSSDRIFYPGAADAVRLLWTALHSLESDATRHQQAARLAAAWLPNHMMTRVKRSQAFAD